MIEVDWPAPARVNAWVSTRGGGVSRAPYSTLNLGAHVGDDPGAVAENRRRLAMALGLPAEPNWLKQVHGRRIVDLDEPWSGPADGAVTGRTGVVCAVLTADCLPVLLAARGGRRVGIAHAGWRGLAAGVIESAVAAMRTPPGELLVWLGPAIGPAAYEVGDEVRTAFVDARPAADADTNAAAGLETEHQIETAKFENVRNLTSAQPGKMNSALTTNANAGAGACANADTNAGAVPDADTNAGADADADAAFRSNRRGRWQADLYALARTRLRRLGVASIHGGGSCTHSESGRFFSHRREAPCGRMASLIWLTDEIAGQTSGMVREDAG